MSSEEKWWHLCHPCAVCRYRYPQFSCRYPPCQWFWNWDPNYTTDPPLCIPPSDIQNINTTFCMFKSRPIAWVFWKKCNDLKRKTEETQSSRAEWCWWKRANAHMAVHSGMLPLAVYLPPPVRCGTVIFMPRQPFDMFPIPSDTMWATKLFTCL